MIRAFKLQSVKNTIKGRGMSMLVMTEEFPNTIAVTPVKPAEPMISEVVSAHGMKIIAKEFHSPIVSMNFSILGGSSAETYAQKGSAQLLACSMFAGNKQSTAVKLVTSLENIGATIKTSVDREKISVSLAVLPTHIDEAIAATISAIAVEPVANYVLEEMKDSAEIAYEQLEADASIQLKELVHEAAYGETAPLGASMFALNLHKLSIDEVMAYRSKYFVPKNIVLTASGVTADTIKQAIDKYGGLFSSPGSLNEDLPSPYIGGEVKVRKDLDATHLAVAFPTPAGAAAKPYAVLNGLLTAKLASKKLPICPFYYQYKSSGLIGFYASGASPAEATYSLEVAAYELKGLLSDDKSIETFKKKVTLESLITLDSEKVTDALYSTKIKNSLADVRDVSSASLSEALKTLLATKPSYVVLGVTAGAPTYATVQKLLK